MLLWWCALIADGSQDQFLFFPYPIRIHKTLRTLFDHDLGEEIEGL
jgi:hypothetical protein